MTKVVVTEKALRETVREAMFNKEFSGWSSNEEGPANVDPNVDPSQAVTDPINPDFKPHTRTEFGVAVNQLVKNLPDTQMSGIFDAVKDAVDRKEQQEDEEEDKMKLKQAAHGQGVKDEGVTEMVVRKAVRKILGEEMVNGVWVDSADTDADEEERQTSSRRSAYKATALGGMSDVSGASFEEIAKELGFSVAGAKQAVDKALLNAQWIAQEIDPTDLDDIVLTAMNDYIKFLAKSDEVTPADVQLMKDHPDIVCELEGFREFLHNYIRKARKADAELVGQNAEEEIEPDEAPATKPAAPTNLAPEVPAPATERPAFSMKQGSGERTKRDKDTYKVYSPYKGRTVARVANKLYGTELGHNLPDGSGKSKFKGGDRVRVSRDGEKLKVNAIDGDHSQTWDPIEQGQNQQDEAFTRDRVSDWRAERGAVDFEDPRDAEDDEFELTPGEEQPVLTSPEAAPSPPAVVAPPPLVAAPPPRTAPVRTGRKEKETYKVYSPYKGRTVARVLNKLYGTGKDHVLPDGTKSKFKGGDRVKISRDGERLNVKAQDSDYTQSWDPIEQGDEVQAEAFWRKHARLVKEALKKFSREG